MIMLNIEAKGGVVKSITTPDGGKVFASELRLHAAAGRHGAPLTAEIVIELIDASLEDVPAKFFAASPKDGSLKEVKSITFADGTTVEF